MSTSISFTSSVFTVNNATQTSQNTVKVTFSQPPLSSSAAGINDSLNPNNYSLIGPAVTSVISVSSIGSVEVSLTLAAPLVAGLWTITFNNLHSAGAVLQVPNPAVLNFQADDVYTQPPLGLGALNRDSEEALKRHAGIFSGKTNWDALWAALGSGDDVNSELAQDVYEQLFASLASGGYLKERASDDGISFPYGIGLIDDVIRKLILRTKNNKLTLQSFLDVLNAFYSDKKTRAFITSNNYQPFALTDENSLVLEIDGDRVEVVFHSESFTSIGAATAEEVANALNAEFSRLNLRCVARADYNVVTTNTHVSIFSGALGLKGYIKVQGGVAQKDLDFPDQLATTQDATTVWAVTQQTKPGIFRFTSTTGTAPSFNLLTVNDYLIVSSANSSLVNRGSFTIIEVGPDYFDIENKKGANQTFTQGTAAGVLFYRPTKYDLNKIELPAFASQFSDTTDVILPATIDLERSYDDATYLGSDSTYTKIFTVNSSKITISNFSRTANYLLINTATDHGLAENEKFLFSPNADGFEEQELVVFSAPTSTSLYAASTGADFGVQPGTDLYIYKNYKNNSGQLILNITAPTNFTADSTVQVTNVIADIDPAIPYSLIAGVMPLYSQNVAKVIVDDTVYFGLSGFTDFYKYNFTTKVLTQLANGVAAVQIKSLCKIVGYDKLFAISDSASQIYDISQDLWTDNITSPTGWANPYCVSLPNGKVFVCGNDSSTSPAQTYDFLTGVWEDINNEYNPEFTELAVSDDGRVLISHGEIGGIDNDDSALYDTYENVFITIPTHGAGARIDPSIIWHAKLRKFLISGGEISGTTSPIIQTFDPQSMSWGVLSNNGPRLFDHQTTILNDNEIVFTGGFTDSAANTSVWIYNLIKDDLTELSLSFDRTYFVAVKNDSYASIWDGIATLLVTKYFNKTTNACNFENDYKVEDVSGKSVTLAPFFNTEATNSFSPIKAPLLNHLGETIYPTVALVKDSASPDLDGNYILDKTVPLSEFVFELNQNLEAGTSYNSITFTSFPTNLPAAGFLVFGYGTEYQTGPVEFFEKTSATTLRIDSNFTFANSIPLGTSVVYAYSSQPLDTVTHAAYLVNPSVVRIYAEDLIASIKASGSNVEITTVYPNDYGLGNSDRADKVSDAIYIWGTQEDLDKER